MALEIEPEIAVSIAAQFAQLMADGEPAADDLEARRALVAVALTGNDRPPAEVRHRDVRLRSFDGAEIGARWYWTKGSSRGPAVVYLHGGGMVAGSIDHYDARIGAYVLRSGVPMLAVEYRLAPEHPFPQPQEDSFSGLLWLVDHADELGVDHERIAVMGDSAGGGLAASVAILARDRGLPLAKQLLIYAMLDDRTTSDPLLLQAPFLVHGYEDNLASWNALLEDRAGSPDIPATAAPARLQDASGLPPAYLEVGEVDIFRAEVLDYAGKLLAHGVSVELHLHAGAPHGYDLFAPRSAVSLRAGDDRIRALKRL